MGLPHPTMNWESPALKEAWTTFEQHARLMVAGPLSEKTQPQQVSYLLLWVGEKGRDIFSTFNFAQAVSAGNASSTLHQPWDRFRSNDCSPTWAGMPRAPSDGSKVKLMMWSPSSEGPGYYLAALRQPCCSLVNKAVKSIDYLILSFLQTQSINTDCTQQCACI